MVNWLGEVKIVIEADSKEQAEKQMHQLVNEIRRLMQMRGFVGHVVPEGVMKEEDFEKEVK